MQQTGEPAVVTALDGEHVRIDSFRRVEFIRRECSAPDDCVETTDHYVDDMRKVTLHPDRIEVVGRSYRRRDWPFETHVVPVGNSAMWARLSERSPQRGLIAGGVAAGVAFGVCIAVTALIAANQPSDAEEPVARPILIGGLAGLGVGGATLLITLPLTHDLGSSAP